MRINAINSNYNANNKCKNPNFARLIKENSALPIINSMSENDKLELKQIEKRLSKTKFWDMKISSIGNEFKEFKFQFINKKNNRVITDGIFPYDPKDKTIRFYSIIYGPENTSLNTLEKLHFKTKERAEELFNEYHDDVLYASNMGYNIRPIDALKMKEIELKMLEEAFITSKGKRNITQVNTEFKTKKTTGNDLSYKD